MVVSARSGVLACLMIASCWPYGALTAEAHETVDLEVTRREDLQELSRLLEEDRSFSDDARRAAHSRLSAMTEAAGTFSPAEFYLRTREICALADNAHTFTLAWPVYEQFGALPIRVAWFGDAAHIVRVKKELRPFLGARITHVAGRTIEDVIAALSRYTGGPVQFQRVYASTNLMLCPALMHAAGLSPLADSLLLGLVDLDGEVQEISLAAGSPP